MPNEVFLRAILDSPHDDTPRLIYADWLDGHGEPDRAAFIRNQCEAARLRPGCARRLERIRRANDLLDQHERNWLGDWSDRLIQWEFDRGFVRSVRLTADTFLRHGEALFRAEPVERVELVNDEGVPLSEDAAGAVVASPAFGFVRDCAVVPQRFASMYRTPLDTWLRALACAPHVNRLRTFGVAGGSGIFNPADLSAGLDEQALAMFCQATHLHTLTTLNLAHCPIGQVPDKDRLVSLIAAAPFARRLRKLTLERCRLTERGIERIASDPVFRRLRQLDVDANTESPAAWQVLFHSATLDRIRDLSITENHLPQYAGSPAAGRVHSLTVCCWSDPDREAWVRGWRQLIATGCRPRRLTFECHNPGREIFEEMRRRHWLREVHTLTLNSNSVGGVYEGRTAGVRCLLRSSALPRLARLQLHEIADSKVLSALASWPGLPRLEELALTSDYYGRLWPGAFAPAHPLNGVSQLDGVYIQTDADVDAFLRIPGLEGLRHLSLWFVGDHNDGGRVQRITVEAAERLLRAPCLQRLDSLSLRFDRPSELMAQDVLSLFTDGGLMPRLRILYVSGTDTAPDAVEAIRRRFGLRLRADR